MACIGKGNSKTSTDQGPHIAGIGVMGVNPVGTIVTVPEMTNQLIGQLIEIRPKLFLTQITPRSKTESSDRCTRCNRLERFGIVERHTPILNQPGDDLDMSHLGAIGQAAGQFQHVEGLTSSVRITAKLQILRAK